jgi:hypothetical protein
MMPLSCYGQAIFRRVADWALAVVAATAAVVAPYAVTAWEALRGFCPVGQTGRAWVSGPDAVLVAEEERLVVADVQDAPDSRVWQAVVGVDG